MQKSSKKKYAVVKRSHVKWWKNRIKNNIEQAKQIKAKKSKGSQKKKKKCKNYLK